MTEEKENKYPYFYHHSYFNLIKYVIFLETILERERIDEPKKFRQGDILDMLSAAYWGNLRRKFSQYKS